MLGIERYKEYSSYDVDFDSPRINIQEASASYNVEPQYQQIEIQPIDEKGKQIL